MGLTKGKEQWRCERHLHPLKRTEERVSVVKQNFTVGFKCEEVPVEAWICQKWHQKLCISEGL